MREHLFERKPVFAEKFLLMKKLNWKFEEIDFRFGFLDH